MKKTKKKKRRIETNEFRPLTLVLVKKGRKHSEMRGNDSFCKLQLVQEVNKKPFSEAFQIFRL